jgi:hypothetical protein
MTGARMCRVRKIIVSAMMSVFMLGSFISCSSGMITRASAFKDLNGIKDYYTRTSALPFERLNAKVGKSGFFYVVSKDGRVIWHPVAIMNGADVSGLPMMREVQSKDSGYGFFDQGGMNRVIFYDQLGDGSKIFLSVDPSEFDEKK